MRICSRSRASLRGRASFVAVLEPPLPASPSNNAKPVGAASTCARRFSLHTSFDGDLRAVM
ncbi:MAG: hypothetical protein I4O49_21815 [Janthinobacterium lividum]|nr:hypothetical protein [Janthinobacterium lividum]